jgi:hypothetical protein
VLRTEADGTALGSLHDPAGGVYGVTSATPHDGALSLGTLFSERVIRYPRAVRHASDGEFFASETNKRA